MMMHFYSREFLRISFFSKANSFCPLFAYTVSQRLADHRKFTRARFLGRWLSLTQD